MVAIAGDGNWYVVTFANQLTQVGMIGSFGGGMGSSGNVFSIDGVGTHGAVDKPGVVDGDVIVECDPTNGMVTGELATTVDYISLYGLAGWEGKIFGFNDGGQVIEIDIDSGQYQVVATTNHLWYGAAVATVLAP